MVDIALMPELSFDRLAWAEAFKWKRDTLVNDFDAIEARELEIIALAHKPSVPRSHPSDIKGRRVRLRSAGTQSKSTLAPKQVRVQARNRRWNADSAITLGAT